MSMTKEDGAPVGERLRDDFRNEEKALALEASVEAIVERVMKNVGSCGHPCECQVELQHYVYKDASHPDIKGKPEYVGKTATKLMEDEIAEEIISLLKRFAEIDRQ